jgi:phosphotransferase system enzyme I (PtsI)
MYDPKPIPERIVQGIPASPGIAQGYVYVFFHKDVDIPVYSVDAHDQPAEIARFEEALVKTRKQISTLRSEVAQKLGEQEASIFDAHLLVIEDKALIEETMREHQQFGYNIEYCFHAVAKRYIEAFDHIQDDYIKERVTDIRDVTKRVLHNLLGSGTGGFLHLPDPRILVSEDVSPSDTAGLDRNRVLGIVTDAGSRTSHAVIMARSLNVPAVVGLHDISAQVSKDDYVLIDGYEGIVIINPCQETLYRYSQVKQKKESLQRVFTACLKEPSETLDGRYLKLVANIEGVDDIPLVCQNHLEGVGLFRTERLFIDADRFAGEEEQFRTYKAVAEAMAAHTVVIRTIDLGGDKKMGSYVFTEKEINPFMGFRAIRFCLEHKAVFKEQLRAVLRASAYGKIKLMYPMVSGIAELMRAATLLEEAKDDLRQANIPFDPDMPVGCMIEIPSAAYTVDILSRVCSFFSIGTNDLIQYMLAVDRGNDKIAYLYDPSHPAIIRTIQHVLKEACLKGIPVSVCGEMAADPVYVPLLLGLGAQEISIAPGMAPEIKYLLRRLRFSECQQLTKMVLQKTDPKEILSILYEFYLSKVGSVVLGSRPEPYPWERKRTPAEGLSARAER